MAAFSTALLRSTLLLAALVAVNGTPANPSEAGGKKSHLRLHSHNASAKNAPPSPIPAAPGAAVPPAAAAAAPAAAAAAPAAPAAAAAAPAAAPKKVATTAASVSTPPAAGVVHLQQSKDDAPPAAEAPSEEAMVSELRQELQELRQHHTNIVQMQQTLTADVALLRESSTMQRAAASQHSRTAARTQVRRAEHLVKQLSAMLRDSRADSTEDAKAMMREATEVRAAADVLAAAASSELRALAPHSARQGLRVQAKKNPMQQPETAAPPAVAAPPAYVAPAAIADAALVNSTAAAMDAALSTVDVDDGGNEDNALGA